MRILVGMSGGLDSTYAASRLLEEGHDVVGAVLIMHQYTELDAARRAAKSVGVPLAEIDCTEAFDKIVKENFKREYSLGRTPNPCVICNSEVKFRFLRDYAAQYGFDRIATGHYAKIIKKEDCGMTRLAFSRAQDSVKDQTYMLWRLPQDIISMLILPLGNDEKSEVRKSAEKIGLDVAHRADSQEICFLPDGNYAEYIEGENGIFPEGDFVSPDGKTIGRHKGIVRYTVGQRKGLGIALGKRMFVHSIRPETNSVILSDSPRTDKRFGIASLVYSGIAPRDEIFTRRLDVKVRYQARPVSASVTFYPEGVAEVELDMPTAFVAPGQSAVFYDGDVVAAGGIIM